MNIPESIQNIFAARTAVATVRRSLHVEAHSIDTEDMLSVQIIRALRRLEMAQEMLNDAVDILQKG